MREILSILLFSIFICSCVSTTNNIVANRVGINPYSYYVLSVNGKSFELSEYKQAETIQLSHNLYLSVAFFEKEEVDHLGVGLYELEKGVLENRILKTKYPFKNCEQAFINEVNGIKWLDYFILYSQGDYYPNAYKIELDRRLFTSTNDYYVIIDLYLLGTYIEDLESEMPDYFYQANGTIYWSDSSCAKFAEQLRTNQVIGQTACNWYSKTNDIIETIKFE